MRVLIAAGGTGGHIVPAIAIANHIKKHQPNCSILFVGTQKGLEKTLVPNAGYDIQYIEALGFKRKINRDFLSGNIRALYKVSGAVHDSKRIIREFKPDVAVGTGGYVSGPVLYAATKLKIPTLIHESNAYPGVASKILSRYVDCVCIGFESSRKYFKHSKKKLILTGNPLRSDMFDYTGTAARAEMGVPSQRTFIVATGGSLGARIFNGVILSFIEATKNDKSYEMLFATGEIGYEAVMQRFNEIYPSPPTNIKILPFVYNMPVAQAAADIIIGCGGAMTLSEITALGKPSILIPSAYVTMNHQEYNARALADVGAAIMFTEKELQEKGHGIFVNAVSSVMKDAGKKQDMAKKSRALGITDGVENIYKLIMDLYSKSK